jgi:hypothetical protein
MVSLATLTQAEKDAAFAAGLTNLRFPTVIVQQFRNTDHLVNYGLSIGFEGSHDAGRLRYGLAATGVRAHNETMGVPLTVGPPVFGNARVSYDIGDGWPMIGLATYYNSRRPIDLAFTPGYLPPPYAPAQLQTRLSVVGPVPKVKGLSYRAMVELAATDKGPYATGPGAFSSVEVAARALQPIEAFRVTAGLEYDF